MKARIHLEQKVQNQKPLNRAQKILKKNRAGFPTWYWRLVEKNNVETITLSWDIPSADIYMDSLGRVVFSAGVDDDRVVL